MDAVAVRQQQQRTRRADEVVPTRTAVLHLRPAPTAEEVELAQRQQDMRVTWDPQVRDPVNQRVSKCCCVFHKKKLFGESSSDDSCSSDDDSSDDDGGAAGHAGAAAGGGHESHCGHDCGHGHQHGARKHRPQCTKEHCYCGTRFH
ncbi:Protein phosphatase inhibitor [Novymonas esmeraldas]|uniref:Protein phosphatase inhibitor n=1 Tax=Novymonas esmeraldas TaxID=1808958 RepID=A0AAW0F5A8_9TRYP